MGEHNFQPFEGGLRRLDPPRSGEILHSSVIESGSKVIMLSNDRESASLIIVLENHMLLLVVQLHHFCFYLLGSGATEVKKHNTLGCGNAHTQFLQDPESLGDRPYVLKEFLRVNHSLKERIIRKPIAVLFAPFRIYLMHDENSEQRPDLWGNLAALTCTSAAGNLSLALFVFKVGLQHASAQ